MGGGESSHVEHHYHTQYVTPPEVQQALDTAKAEVAILKEEAVKREDPKYFKENAVKSIDKFAENVKTMDIKSLIDVKPDEYHIGFIGNISAGKSSALNALFNLSEPVALDHCTTECKVVHSATVDGKTYYYWDVPGSNDDYEFYNYENLGFIKSLWKVIIVYDNDPMMITNMIKVINAINADNIVYVRTKCDQGIFNVKPVHEVKADDIKKIKRHANNTDHVYMVSAHNIINANPLEFEWEDFKKEFIM